MKDNFKLIKVFTGTEFTVNLLKDELENINIFSIVKNDYGSGVVAGFSGGTQSSIYLYINEIDMEAAKAIIDDFKEINSD